MIFLSSTHILFSSIPMIPLIMIDPFVCASLPEEANRAVQSLLTQCLHQSILGLGNEFTVPIEPHKELGLSWFIEIVRGHCSGQATNMKAWLGKTSLDILK